MTTPARLAAVMLATTWTHTARADCYEDWKSTPPTSNWYRPTAACVHEMLDRWESKEPDRFEVRVIGHTPGGVEIPAIRVTNGISDPEAVTRPVMMVMGGIHSEERSAHRSLLDWLDTLHNSPRSPAYPKGPTWDTLLDHVQLWIVPRVNMETTARCNAAGINLNRDFPYRWNVINETTTSCVNNNSIVPASQPETRAIMGFARTLQPDVVVSAHGHVTPLELLDDSAGDPETHASCAGQSMEQRGSGTTWLFSVIPVEYQVTGPFSIDTVDHTRPADLAYHTLLDPSTPQNLARLSEQNSPKGLVYAPYDPDAICDLSTSRGKGVGTKQTRSWMEAQMGAVGVLLEHLREDPREIEAGIPPTDRMWAPVRSEQFIQSHTRDTHAGLGRLMMYTIVPENPGAPGPALAVQSVLSPYGECNHLETFYPEGPGATPQDDVRIGQYGEHAPTCFISNRGSATSTAGTSQLRVEDLTDPSASTVETIPVPPINPGERVALEASPVTFEKSHLYDVSCELTSGADPYIIRDDIGCGRTNGADSTCVWNATTNGFDAVYDGWARRSHRFRAEHDMNSICVSGVRMPVDVNGN